MLANIMVPIISQYLSISNQFPGGLDGKASAYNARDLGSIPGLGRSPGAGNGNPLQNSCLENSVDSGLQSMVLQRVGHERAQHGL